MSRSSEREMESVVGDLGCTTTVVVFNGKRLSMGLDFEKFPYVIVLRNESTKVSFLIVT